MGKAGMISPISQMRKMKARVVTWARSLSLVHRRGGGGGKMSLGRNSLHCVMLHVFSKEHTPYWCQPACFSCPKIIELG